MEVIHILLNDIILLYLIALGCCRQNELATFYDTPFLSFLLVVSTHPPLGVVFCLLQRFVPNISTGDEGWLSEVWRVLRPESKRPHRPQRKYQSIHHS